MAATETSPHPPPQDGMLRIRAAMAGRLNLADYQNAVPALRELAVINETATAYEHLVVTATSEPAFFAPRQWRLDALGPQQTCQFGVHLLDLKLDGPLLARLQEAAPSRVSFRLARAGREDAPLAEHSVDVELLPRNQWGGNAQVPEMLGAFVQPNDPVVDQVLKQAAGQLRRAGRDAALNGYDSGSRHAWEILAAIWNALAAAQLDYTLPPASFEQTGQKVRTPGQVFSGGVGTCLDLALLFAAAAEQAGLNPLVMLLEGHAFAGCWLKREEFADAVVDDVAALRKRLGLKQLVLLETTLLTEQPAPSFERACERGKAQIANDAERRFEAVLDVRRARLRKIKPLATEAELAQPPEQIPTSEAFDTPLPDAPHDLPDEADEPAEPNYPETPQGRISKWQRKLLDLSLRNPLLNFRAGKRSLTLDAPEPGRLEDVLASGHPIKILPRPALMEGNDPRNRTLFETQTQQDALLQHALAALERRQVHAPVDAAALDKTLVGLYRLAQTALEEGGANVLFLALGLLAWTPTDRDKQALAPLILIPVKLQRQSVRSGFTMALHEDEAQFNPTLVEMLRQDFQLQLGIGEGDLPKDDAGLDVDGIWRRVEVAIKDVKGWEVKRQVVLATFSFARHLMWKDLVHRQEQLRENPVVRHLIDAPRETYPAEVPFVNAAELDEQHHPGEVFCPLPADSSQLQAVLSAARGKSFVLIGPPGTGKSQTIANLIAHSLATGRRVLFVAEKMAALNVVYDRLKRMGLERFCLQLHSSKAKKAEVLGTLRTAWNELQPGRAQEWASETARVNELRQQLNAYVQRLHQPRPNGYTVHRAFGITVQGRQEPRLALQWPDAAAHTAEHVRQLHDCADRLQRNATVFGMTHLRSTALRVVGRSEWTPLWADRFTACARDLQAVAGECLSAFERLALLAGLPPDLALTPAERQAVTELAAALPECIGRPWSFAAKPDREQMALALRRAAELVRQHREVTAHLGQPWPADVLAAARRGAELLDQRQALRASLPQPWPERLRQELNRGLGLLQQMAEWERGLSVQYDQARLDVPALERTWQQAQHKVWPLSRLDKNKVRTALRRAAQGGEPDAANDIVILGQWAQARREAERIDLTALPAGVWAGTRTQPEPAADMARLQAGLAAVKAGGRWQPVDLALIDSGLCDEAARSTLDALRRLETIEQELDGLAWLALRTDGLWQDRATPREAWTAAIAFCTQWQAGERLGTHELVAAGTCGEYLRGQHALLQRQAELAYRLQLCDELAFRTNGLWQGLETNLDEVESAVRFATLLGRSCTAFGLGGAGQETLYQACARLCAGGVGLDQVRAAVAAWQRVVGALPGLVQRLAAEGSFGAPQRAEWEEAGVRALVAGCAALADEAGQGSRLKSWCEWVEVRTEAHALGLGSAAGLVEQGELPGSGLRRVVEVNYCRWWLKHVVDGDDLLRRFSRVEHADRIGEFRRRDDRIRELTRDIIHARLAANVPDQQGLLPPDAGWPVLRHHVNLQKPRIPVRQLLEKCAPAITALTPCLLMSPQSIAQYLSLAQTKFDLVVFDEASQIPVPEAIGAIARGHQVVMVGDPKQLPPTSFFDRTEEDEEEADATETVDEQESILDECILAGLPQLKLRWHYRSKDESLIAFSNRRFYDGELVTFPAPVNGSNAVRLRYVGGTYGRGGSGTNPDEAQAVVRDVVERLRGMAGAAEQPSIGIVTLNEKQQRLIQDLLDEERRSDESLETFFGEEVPEPVFVKNLENVQGDERDIIYFSTTFGPDGSGRPIAMNFGPLNRAGGERRLNVAITRARQEMCVFTSLRPEDIDLARTSAQGMAELKHFLEYAARGPAALDRIVTTGGGAHESPFEEAVAAALRACGWTVHAQIGVSSFRIDLAVVHPDEPGRYLAGVECDGATYHRSATARDRDKLRQEVLESLGWQLLRIWSTDWWLSPQEQVAAVNRELQRLLE